jgi:hypothetical protein
VRVGVEVGCEVGGEPLEVVLGGQCCAGMIEINSIYMG